MKGNEKIKYPAQSPHVNLSSEARLRLTLTTVTQPRPPLHLCSPAHPPLRVWGRNERLFFAPNNPGTLEQPFPNEVGLASSSLVVTFLLPFLQISAELYAFFLEKYEIFI